MATQDESGIEFSIVSEESQQHFRLLELPKELLSLLTSENAPMLQLKSQEEPPGHDSDSNAVLCTPDKTYSLRQVSTSNTVYLAQPTTTSSDDGSGLPRARVEAIAQLHSTLELQPLVNQSAIPYIKAVLPTYTSTGHYGSKEAISKRHLFNNIPLSDSECELAWKDSTCFEMEDSGRALLPSASVKLKVWEAMLTTATAAGIDLTEPLDEEIQSSVSSADGYWPRVLSQALLRSMAGAFAPFGDMKLDETKCARIVGESLLEDRTGAGSPPMSKATFMSTWADLLPEKWRGCTNLKLLEGCCKLGDGGRQITFVEADNHAGAGADGSAPAEAKSTLGAKRKWHEKFRASKKTA